jgi:hypothetical protein
VKALDAFDASVVVGYLPTLRKPIKLEGLLEKVAQALEKKDTDERRR